MGQANAIHELACVKYIQADFKAAKELFETALGHYRDLDDARGRRYALLSLGRTRHAMGDFAGTAALMRSALAEFEALGDTTDRGVVLAILAALAAFEQIGNHLGIANRAQHAAGHTREAAGLLGGTKAEGGA